MSLIQQWLRDKAALYDSPGLVYAHLTAALAAYPPLRPKLDVYSPYLSFLATIKSDISTSL